MGRVKIKFPAELPTIIVEIPIRISDVNYGGHVGNDSILSIIHEARMQMLAKWGMTELNIGGPGLIMADVMIAYRGESFYGDTLLVEIYVEDITEYTFDLLYLMRTERNGQMMDVAHAKTTMVCFDYTTRTKVSVPDYLKKLF